MVRLDPDDPGRTLANPINADGVSIKLTDSVDPYIEENPSMVLRDGTYTLFTSFGWYGACHYFTRYRQNPSLWHGWLAEAPHRLAFPAGLDTCGTGNAQVIQGLPGDSWRIFFNGHTDGPHTGLGLYVGVVRWSGGTPEVSGIL